MLAPIHVDATVHVPLSALSVQAVRAGGPGGQNVNKVASKVDLRVDLGAIVGLADDARARLRSLCATRLDAEGRLVVTSQRTRDQQRNIEDCCEKVRALIAQAMVRPKRRRATRPTRGSVERRLEGKRRTSEKKAGRRGFDG